MPSGTEQQRFRTGDTRSTAAGEDGMDETLVIGGTRVRRQTLRPGWRASEQPGADAFCQLPHFRYQISGSIGVRFSDGTELVAEPGDVSLLPAGHDEWVIGGQVPVVIDWVDASAYAP